MVRHATLFLRATRRLAAIRALENPESIATAVKATILTKLRDLSRQYQENPIVTMPCVVVKDPEEARHWIELRHTGLNEGAGTMPWGADESARFRARSRTPDIHSQALDFLTDRGDLSREQRSKVPVTSFRRLLGTPQVRTKLGLELSNGVLSVLADKNKIAKALVYVINDLSSGKIKTADIYTQHNRREYARNLPQQVVVKPTLSSGQGAPLLASAGTTKAKGRRTRRTTDRTKLIPTSCVLDISSRRIDEIENELRKLSLKDYTNAVGVLFRVFIELSVDSYLENHPSIGVQETAALQKKMSAVAQHLVDNGKLTRKQRTPVSRACQKDSFLAPSIDLMHSYVHNEHAFPAPGDLRAHWDSLEPFFAAIWTP